MTNEEQGQAAMACALDAFGHLQRPGELRRRGAGEKILGREGRIGLASFAKAVNINLVGTFNMLRLAAEAIAKEEPGARRRARRDHQHRLGRGL